MAQKTPKQNQSLFQELRWGAGTLNGYATYWKMVLCKVSNVEPDANSIFSKEIDGNKIY